MILIQSELYLSAAFTKRYQCTQEDESKVVENTLQNAPSHLKHSQYNRQAVEEESYAGEIELKTKEGMKIEDLHHF